MNRTVYCAFLVSVVLLGGCGKTEQADKTEAKRENAPVNRPSQVYLTKIISCMNQAETQLDAMVKAADEAAVRLVHGGRIFVTDDETIFRTGDEETLIVKGGGYSYPMHEDWGGFVAEACVRAGGLRHIQPVPVKGELTNKDVVLVGTLELHSEDQVKQCTALKKKGALLIVFGSKNSKVAGIADHLIDNGLEPGLVPVMKVSETDTIGLAAGIANVIGMWTFTAELVAALTRQGKMPAMWQSMFVPGAAPRNERAGGFMFHPDMRIMPVEPRILGRQYITEVRGYLEKILQNEIAKFLESGRLCAETSKNGKKIIAGLIGHFMVSQRRMPGFPSAFVVRENEYGADQLKDILASGDVWLHIGYSYYPERELKYAREVGANTVCVFTPGPTDIGEGIPVQADTSLIDIYIDPYWKHGDSVVEVPDYDTKIIPPSGVVMCTCLWMLVGETMAELAGKK